MTFSRLVQLESTPLLTDVNADMYSYHNYFTTHHVGVVSGVQSVAFGSCLSIPYNATAHAVNNTNIYPVLIILIFQSNVVPLASFGDVLWKLAELVRSVSCESFYTLSKLPFMNLRGYHSKGYSVCIYHVC